MENLIISSTFNLCPSAGEDCTEYINRGLEFYKEHGYGAAEFGATMLSLSTDKWKKQVEDAIEASERTGVRFATAHLPYLGGGGVKSAEYMERFDREMYASIDAMKMLGVNCAIFHPNAATVVAKDFDRKKTFESVMAHLAPYAEYAAKVGLSVVVENMRVIHGMRHSHRYCQDPDELCEVADALGIGVCWDFGHANISGVKQSKGLAYVGKRLKVLHVNDNFAGDDIHILPFTGNVDWKDAMHGLALAEFDGLFNFELSVARVPAELRSDFAKYVSHAADELMGYIE